MEKLKWISVEERLPEDFDTKVVWTDRGILYLATFTGLRWYASGGDTIRDEEVTHWMSLPDPPERASSFDTDEFFNMAVEASLKRTYGEAAV